MVSVFPCVRKARPPTFEGSCKLIGWLHSIAKAYHRGKRLRGGSHILVEIVRVLVMLEPVGIQMATKLPVSVI